MVDAAIIVWIVIGAFLFASAVIVGFVAFDRSAAVKIAETNTDQFKDMTNKYVEAMGKLNGPSDTTAQMTAEVLRLMGLGNIDDGRQTANGRVSVNPTGQRPPAGWTGEHRGAATQSS